MKSQSGKTLFLEFFYFNDFFRRTFLLLKFRTLFPKTFFLQITFLAVSSNKHSFIFLFFILKEIHKNQ